MKVSMSYSTRKLIILNQIRGYNNEHLIDNIEFTIPNELSGFNIGLLFAQDDHTPVGAVSLALAWTSGMLTYSVPNGLTIYREIEFQIVAAHPTDGRVWKSQIGHFYFDEPLPDHTDMPFTELSPYPDWIAAIEAALAAADAANEAALAVNGVVADAQQAILDITETEAIIIANEATRQEIYNDLLSVNGLVYVSNGAIRSATKEDIGADTVTNGAGISVTNSVNGSVTTYNVSHSDPAPSLTNGAFGSNGIASITLDEFGHITNISTSDYQPRYDGEPQGFVDRNQVSLSFDNLTRTLTITPTGTSFEYWSDGNYFTSAGVSYVIPDVEGNRYIWFDENGVIQSGNFSLDIIKKYCLIASLYWDFTNKKAIPSAITETHGIEMPADTHAYLHSVFGTQYISGMALSITLGTGDSNTDAQFSASGGVMNDEDIPNTILSRTLTDTIPVLYKTGADGLWRMDNTRSFPLINTGTGRAAYNSFSDGVWGLTEVPELDYVLAHIFAIPGLNNSAGSYIAVVGQNYYTQLADAQQGASTEALTITTLPLPIAETKLVGTIIIQTRLSYANSVNARFVATTTGATYIDWRKTGYVASGAASTTATWGAITGDISLQTDLQNGFVNATGDTMTGDLTAPVFISNTIQGNAPFQVSSTTVVSNLNADLLDGQHGSFYAPIDSPTFTGDVNGITSEMTGSEPANSNIQQHIIDVVNPHNTTYEQVGAEPSGAVYAHNNSLSAHGLDTTIQNIDLQFADMTKRIVAMSIALG